MRCVMFFPIWALGESAASAAVTTAAAATPRRNRFRTRMGTEFEDENAKEKLRAMLNKQFGIGDVSAKVPVCAPGNAVASIAWQTPVGYMQPLRTAPKCFWIQ